MYIYHAYSEPCFKSSLRDISGYCKNWEKCPSLQWYKDSTQTYWLNKVYSEPKYKYRSTFWCAIYNTITDRKLYVGFGKQ